MLDSEDLSQVEASLRAGLDSTYIAVLMQRGSCSYFGLDLIACSLGLHPITFVVGDLPA